ncbi:ran [Symbiodinium sp. CCMP2592]|nr:ran [Symbiodinium sp. CCMP2592]
MFSRLWGFVQSITSKRPSSEEAPPAKRARVQTSVDSNAPESENARPATALASQASGPAVEYKLVLLGDAGVGKTCFVKRHVTGEFVKKYRPTEGCEMKKLKISTSRGPVLFQVWDTAGQDHLAGLRDGYFIGAQCAMVFFDVTKRESHQNLAKWVTDLRKVAGEIPVVVVGNKVDAPGRVVKAQEGSVIMRKLKVQYYDLSVRTRFNTEVPLLFLSRRLLGDSSLRLTPEAGSRPPEPILPSAAEQRRAARELADALNVAINDSDDVPSTASESQQPQSREPSEAAKGAWLRARMEVLCRCDAIAGRRSPTGQLAAVALEAPTRTANATTELGRQRQLVAEVEVLSVARHPKEQELQLLQVSDPDFPSSPPLPVVAEAGKWKAGDRALLVQVGSRVPRGLAKFEGAFRALAGQALAQTQGAMEGPLSFKGEASVGFLISNDTERVDEVEPLQALQSRVALELAFCGDDFRGSLGSDASVEAAVRAALLQVGVVPPLQKPPFQRLSRTDAGVHARSFRLVVPLLRVQASDLQADGRCPGLQAALNRRLPNSLRILEVARVPYMADIPSACVAREYRYYLPRSLMGPGAGDVDPAVERRLALALQCCQGRWPFLNFTKPELYRALEENLRSTPETERWLRELYGHRRRRRERGYPPDNRVADLPALLPVPEEGRDLTVREVRVCELLPEPVTATDSTQELLCVRLVGEGFLNSMVRLIVGSCCAVARGVLPITELKAALAAEQVVDLSEFVAPAAGLVLYQQHFDEEKIPWLPLDRSAEEGEAFFRDAILSRVERAWGKTRSLGPWYQPSPEAVVVGTPVNGAEHICFERDVEHVRPGNWIHTGQGRGAYEKIEDMQFVGQGRGSWDRERLPVYGWRCNICCLCFCGLLLLAVIVSLLMGIFWRQWTFAADHRPHSDALQIQFDCALDYFHWETVWTDEKKAFCCSQLGKGCAVTTQAPAFDCDAAYDNWHAAWSKAKKVHCCATEQKGCTGDDCYDGDQDTWTDPKRTWCCEKHALGCPKDDYDCRAGVTNWRHGWSESKKYFCCKKYDVACPDSVVYDCSSGIPIHWPSAKQEAPEVVSSYTDKADSPAPLAELSELRTAVTQDPSASRVPSKWSRLQHMRHLEVDAEILRGIPLQVSLRALGELWRRSPVDLPEEARRGLYDLAAPVEGFDVFLSHTWMSPGRYKVLNLLFQAGWKQVLLSQSLFVMAGMVLSLLRWLPLPFVLPPEFEEYSHLESPFFPWCLVMAFVGSSLGLMLTPYFPALCGWHPVCFLDVVSIHQVDKELMERGIYGLGGFLRVSRELRVLWSAPYLSRLWCVFELAAYRMANPSGRIVVSPIFVEVGALVTILFTYFVAILFSLVFVLSWQEVGRVMTYVIALVPLILLLHLMRRNLMSKHRLMSDLRLFDLEKAYCRTDFDREFIHRAIIEWYGSKEAFTQYVRGPLREELLRSTKSAFPLRYLFMVTAVTFSASLDSLVALWLGGMTWEVVLSEFVGNSIGFHLGYFLGLLNFVVYLCDRFAAPKCSGVLLDYLQSVVMFLVFFGLYYLGQVVNRRAYTTSLWSAVIWASAALLWAGLSLRLFQNRGCCKADKTPRS